MVRLVLCLALFAVGAVGQEFLIPEDSIIGDQLSEVKADIPYDIPGEDDAGSIPMNGNFIFRDQHNTVLGYINFMNRMYHCCKWRFARTTTAFNPSEYIEFLRSGSRRNYFIS